MVFTQYLARWLVFFAILGPKVVDSIVSTVLNDFLFVLHDAGESLGLQDPLLDLAAAGYTVRILALGNPAESIYASDSFNLSHPEVRVDTLGSLGIPVTVVDGNSSRHQILTPSNAEQIVTQTLSTMVVTGMVYSMQAQLAAGYRARSAFVVGFDDSFSLWDNTSLTATEFVSPLQTTDEVFVTASSIAQEVDKLSGGRVASSVTGSPTLDDWQTSAANSTQVQDTLTVLQGINPRFGTGQTLPMLIFAGGYGDESYSASLEVFCDAVSALRQNVLFVFSPHPGYPSSYEASLFREWGCLPDTSSSSGNLIVLDDNSGLSTTELVSASNGSLSMDSTVGPQSVSIGKPHTYIAEFEDVFSVSGLIPISRTSVLLIQTINVTFRESQYYIAPQSVEAAGVPLNGTANVDARLEALLRTGS